MERRSDLRVGRAASHQSQDVVLALSEQVESRRVTRRRGDDPPVAVEHPRRHPRVEPCAAPATARTAAIRSAQESEDEPRSARLDRALEDFVLAERREHEYVQRVVEAAQVCRRGDPI